MLEVLYAIMKTIKYLLPLCSVLSFCTSPGGETLEATAEKTDKDDPSATYHSVIYDWDKNGVRDTFTFAHDNEEVVMQINAHTYRFSTLSTVYEKFSEPSVLLNNQLADSCFIFFKLDPQTEVLLLKDKGDYSGPILNVWTYKNKQVSKIWEGEGGFVKFSDLDGNNSVEFILEEIQFEPGSTKEYEFVNYTLFKVYTYSKGEIRLDSLLSHEYNLRHKPTYGKAVQMKKPVLARRIGSNSIEFDLLLDLAQIK